MQQSVAKNNNDRFQLKVQDPIPFEGTLNGKIMTSFELTKLVNSLFRPVFADYEGSIISQNHFGQVEVTLFFKDKGGGNIIPLATPMRGHNVSPRDRIAAMNLRNRNKTYQLSDELKDVLEGFMDVPPRGGVNWDQKVYEVSEPQPYGGNVIYVRVDGVNINKILKVIYGSRNENNGRLDYNVTVIKPISAVTHNSNYIIKIDQLDVSKVEQLAAQVGMLPTIGTIPIIRD